MIEHDDEARELRLEGMSRAERALELNPNDARALSLVPGFLLLEGQAERALELSERSPTLYPDDMSTLINGACLRARLGLKDRALDLLEMASRDTGATGTGSRTIPTTTACETIHGSSGSWRS